MQLVPFYGLIRWVKESSLVVYITLLVGLYYTCMDIARHDRLNEAMRVLVIYAVATLIFSRYLGSLLVRVRCKDLRPALSLRVNGARFSIFGSFNNMAGSLAIFIGFALSIISEIKIPVNIKRVSLIVMPVSLIMIGLTLSRSAFAGVALLFLVFVIIKRRWLYLGIFCGIGLPLLLFSGIGHKFLGNYQELLDVIKTGDFLGLMKVYSTLFSRALLWNYAISDLVTNWSIIIGRGAGAVEQWAGNTPFGIIHSESWATGCASTPRAALLSALAGIAITFIAMGFILQIFASPLIAVLPMMLILSPTPPASNGRSPCRAASWPCRRRHPRVDLAGHSA